MLVLNLPPDYYTIEVTAGQLVIVPAGGVAVELFEDQELTFELSKGGATRGPSDLFRSSRPDVRVIVPEGREVVLRHLGTGQEDVFRSSKKTPLPIGDYMTELRVPDGPVILSREISVARDKKTRIGSAHWKGGLASESIAKMFPPHHGGLEFSESLGGAITDPDLSLWLAILGGARIIGSRGDYSKISRLPLRGFSSEAPGSSPVYLLAGFPDSDVKLSLGLSTDGAKTEWFPAREPQGMKGLREVVAYPPQGQCFITLAVGRQPTYTLASFASPNRCALIVLTLDAEGAPRVEQYLLPMGHLIMNLDPSVRKRLEERNQLKDVRVLAQLSGAFGSDAG